MNYKELGLDNTRAMFAKAMNGAYAVPAFNFYNMESLQAIMAAAQATHSPVILAVSESALAYMGENLLTGIIYGQKDRWAKGQFALHLDHGHSFESCRRAIDLGFSSVMIDGSELPFSENIALTRQVAEYAHSRDVSVEAELGALAGIEDENTRGEKSSYTDPTQVAEFAAATNCDSLAVAIGTSHGAYKRKNESEELRFDILAEIAKLLPEFPLVLHGASQIPQNLVAEINANGGAIGGARGIPTDQIRRAVAMNVCKINVDSDGRLAWTAAIRETAAKTPESFDPRKFLTAARDKMTALYMDEIKNVMGSDNKI
ncbi:MAG: ketose-bisphosphate aldolase [Rickettsiales bacterium]|jgi:fructose-bisphosphate aldolase class II|nr:ketose-bisphosphate aldolase [Rickettsiales bacterium]